mmetsp:Transcript_23986/g.66689  ORF Transcript_23986/g.66689 Transcript_23986/m.66689 type:complete len:305 (+) Transcript_23986:204-1118(+)
MRKPLPAKQFTAPEGLERAQRVLAPGARPWVDRRHGAAGAGLHEAEARGGGARPALEAVRRVLGEHLRPGKQQIRAEALECVAEATEASYLVERGLRADEQREPICKLRRALRVRLVDTARARVPEQPQAGRRQTLREPLRGLVATIEAFGAVSPHVQGDALGGPCRRGDAQRRHARSLDHHRAVGGRNRRLDENHLGDRTRRHELPRAVVATPDDHELPVVLQTLRQDPRGLHPDALAPLDGVDCEPRHAERPLDGFFGGAGATQKQSQDARACQPCQCSNSNFGGRDRPFGRAGRHGRSRHG